ncbi:sigma-70 family RNA polymerase sigma factor [Saccharomonospora azurea]|uniref:sigma-70 family RNA polymerase sigma factor n=1 Tax=Saccharomonospora azurea TaxID=40988 RepID=UPI0033266FA1
MSVFEAARPRLTAMAFRILGSVHDADDAVQSTWIKASTADTDGLRNPDAWMTTVLSRVCLDQLRRRRRHGEDALYADELPAEVLTADERYLRREDVSRALMVVLHRLTPVQRVAYVLHDLFDFPFRDVARALGTSAGNAKQHASRARRRIAHSTFVPGDVDESMVGSVVDAFLAAAAGGDIDRMLALMTDDCVRTVDAGLVPPGTPTAVTGASAVAEETTLFADRVRASTPVLVDGHPAYVIAPGGHPIAVIRIELRNGRVAAIDIRSSARSTFTLLPQALC